LTSKQSFSDLLEKAVNDYLLWMISKGYADMTYMTYERILKHFIDFIIHRAVQWDSVFTYATMTAFQEERGLYHGRKVVRGLSRFLFKHNRIKVPIEKPVSKLPEIYEDYLVYYKKAHQVSHSHMLRTRRTLAALNDYLKSNNINLHRIKIEHLDNFLTERNKNYTPATCQNQRSNIRGFLKYLFHERRILRKDFASMIVGAPMFADTKPPKFLRPNEVQKLFASMSDTSPKTLRTAAMIHLGYTLGIRPKEISLISLDDISFSKGEIRITDRKNTTPILLPLPETSIKAIAAYIIGGRPQNNERTLFLTLKAPFKPILPVTVSHEIGKAMRKAGIPSSAYWLRHTYAQNLLESGSSIFEIKELLGHDKCQTSRRYIHIHTKLMREVLFDETL
jgi:integrase/recombinase XerD